MTGETSTAAPIGLDEPAAENAALVGNKAATLALLRRAGFEVPEGVVIPASALAGAGDDLPPMVRLGLARVPELLGTGPWVVRSSSTAEDSEQASFAGQFVSDLEVDESGLAEAVLRCWRSGQSSRARAYAGQEGPGSMAVLIQPMIRAEAAGVAFTTDPVGGVNHIVIEAVKGLGEGLVSGAANPERWTVEEDGSIVASAEAAVLDPVRAGAVGDLARRVEKHLGRPQDIEWAIAEGKLWLLQARPITTLTAHELIPIPIEVPSGYWERDSFHEPVPLSPFGRVVLTEQILKVFPRAFAEFGILLERVEVKFIGGWIYRGAVLVGPSPGRAGTGPPPRWLLRILFRVHPGIRRRIRAARWAITSDLPGTVIRRWNEEWQPEHRREIVEALAVDLGSLSDQELVAQLDHRIGVLGHPAHVMVAIAYWIRVYQLAETCRELLGWDSAKTLALLDGLSTTSTEPARRLADLATPAVAELLADVDETTLDRVAEIDPGFARAFSDHVEAIGHRSPSYDVIQPTFAETPHVLFRLVADQLKMGFSSDRAAEEASRLRSQTAGEARQLLALHPEAYRQRFERALTDAREAYPALEDRAWWTLSVQAAHLRYVALEMGRRMVDRGLLAAVGDVFFLEAHDARSALVDGADRRETARVARGQREWAMANPGPHSYGDPPPGPPPFDLLPPPARLVNQGMLWGTVQLFGEPPNTQEGGVVVAGTPASAGRYTGTVRVVMGENEFTKIRPGDVVVCPVTSPAWSVVFPGIGALVTDGGGILSHPAIIAREHRIPAVVGTGNATKILKDGQRVTVDGNSGSVDLDYRAR